MLNTLAWIIQFQRVLRLSHNYQEAETGGHYNLSIDRKLLSHAQRQEKAERFCIDLRFYKDLIKYRLIQRIRYKARDY